MAVLCVHRQEPNWPDDPNRPRYLVPYKGRRYWAETNGGEPHLAEVVDVLERMGEVFDDEPDEPEVDLFPESAKAAIVKLAAELDDSKTRIQRLEAVIARLAVEASRET
jgi:hypothetical protein